MLMTIIGNAPFAKNVISRIIEKKLRKKFNKKDIYLWISNLKVNEIKEHLLETEDGTAIMLNTKQADAIEVEFSGKFVLKPNDLIDILKKIDVI